MHAFLLLFPGSANSVICTSLLWSCSGICLSVRVVLPSKRIAKSAVLMLPPLIPMQAMLWTAQNMAKCLASAPKLAGGFTSKVTLAWQSRA
jgi:hypothetical protein